MYQYRVFYRLLDDGAGTKTGRRTKATFHSGTALKRSDLMLFTIFTIVPETTVGYFVKLSFIWDKVR